MQQASFPPSDMFRSSPKIYTAPEPTRIQMIPQQYALITRTLQYPFMTNFQKSTTIQKNTSTFVSKEQLLNNHHLEPIYDKKTSDNNNPLKFTANRSIRTARHLGFYKLEHNQDSIVIDSSARECNEWSIFGVTLPTQLHVKCHCFITNS
ncbi:hypothetical protein DICVIV_00150 [Dictyocaulus viviparus]|uniref:Uncharacterized protein n=1 Tax=Dictyocaulus viviparus TaxID=29172 RepID=A0A0D8YGB8_DICVI|nr:hypothetical protein DICVIV_00150 [Dictyocaulus viviparus]